MKFIDQYGDDAWKTRREEIIKIDGKRCRRCGSFEKLQVHHIHYKNGFNVWDYDDNELVTLCKSCHQEIHHYKEYVNDALFILMNDWCHNNEGVADYNDAWMILKLLAETPKDHSKRYASICIQNGFILGGEIDE